MADHRIPSEQPDIHDEIPSRPQILDNLQDLDRSVFEAIAGWESPILDEVLPKLSDAANQSKISIAIAALLSVFGGHKGRQAAAEGLLAIGITSGTANVLVKGVAHRKRPEVEVPEERRLEQPTSSSFPSGHTASAAAFAGVVGRRVPLLWIPLNALAVAVGFSRVYTGVHYPGDVFAGWALGKTTAAVVLRTSNAVLARRQAARSADPGTRSNT
jgi:undecaprenyl-diphosphatase